MDVRRAVTTIWVVASTMALLAVAPARADPGDPDPAFGGDGFVQVRRLFRASYVAFQPNGKILVLGYGEPIGQVWIVRFRPNGRVDHGYGDGGFASFNAEGAGTSVIGLDVDGRGRAVAAQAQDSTVSRNFLVVHRFTRAGHPDRSFAGDGVVTTKFQSAFTYGAMDVLGRIVAGGFQSFASPNPVDLVVARYRGDGSLDRSFGGDGRVLHALCCEWAGQGLSVDPSGRVVVAGFRGDGGRVNVVRLTPRGTFDRSFSDDGRAALPAGIDSIEALTTGPDGEVVLVGSPSPFHSHWSVVLLGPDGRPDPGFGGDGVVRTRVSCKVFPSDALLQDDGKIVVAGNTRRCRDRAFGHPVVVRYLPNGELDRSFGDGGVVRAPMKGTAAAVAVQPDRRLVTALRPYRFDAETADVARLLP